MSAQAIPTPENQPASEHQQDMRTFVGLNATMFQGALSDNVYRFFINMMVIDLAARIASDEEAQNKLAAGLQGYINLAFALPWIVGVAFAGWLGNRFSKSRVTQWTKLMEIGVMTLAVGAFYTVALNAKVGMWCAIGVMFLMALQSTLFSPSKYGILPEILSEKKIAWGNGILQGFTFIAIVFGTVIGPWLYATTENFLWIAGVFLVLCAVIGYGLSLTMRSHPAANPQERLTVNPLPNLGVYGREILAHGGIKWAVAGLVIFQTVAIMLQSAAIHIAKTTFSISNEFVGIAMLPIVIGLGAGCFLTSFLSRKRIELGLVPLGAFGVLVTCIAVWLMTPVGDYESIEPVIRKYRLDILTPLMMGLVGFFAGVFSVPIQSYILQKSDPRIRGGVWATTGMLIAFGWAIGGAGLYPLIVDINGSAGLVFLFSGLAMLVICALMCWRFPRIPLRLMTLLFCNMFYRVDARGIENVPDEGGACLTPNHQSYLDALLLAAALDRDIRFVMSRKMYNTWYIWPFAKATNSIPIEASQSPKELIRSLRAATDEVKNGGLICIFPEGMITRNGMMQPFRRGVERIMKDTDAPLIPVAIDGAYDSPWAKVFGKHRFSRILRTHRLPVRLVFGKPMPPTTPLPVLRHEVATLMVDAYADRKAEARPLHRVAVATLRAAPFARRNADHNTDGMIPNWKLMTAIVAIGRKLKREWADEEFVGVLLPPAIGAVSINVAALLAGKIAVNLNYSASTSVLQKTCETAGIRLLLTSRVFLEKGKFTVPEGLRVIYMEDIRDQIGSGDRIKAILWGFLSPVGILERHLGRRKRASMDDVATLIFSSGSTGIPKGVMLSHWNIYSNMQGASQYFDLHKGTIILGILPFFHSFGYMAVLWLSFYSRVSVAYYPNPLDGATIGAMVEKYKVTLLFATPTFLTNYIRRVEPSQFGSLEFVVTGAEKLRDYISNGFADRFGVRPVEGFGCTECSPAVSFNGINYREPGLFQRGARAGTVGHPLPGVVVRILDLNTREPMKPGEAGMLQVKGPNIMLGYYKMPEKTAEVLKDGWYETGDLAKVEEDGFLTITDRLARFSKIAGEMVPHMKVEEALQKIVAAESQVFAVTGVPDEKKGERLVVLYTIEQEKAREAAEALNSPELNLPSLWKPKWADFVKVDEIPMLGSGKMDLQRIKELASANGEPTTTKE